MDALNELVTSVLGDSWGLLFGAIGIFFVVVVRTAGMTSDVRNSPKAQDKLELLTALGSLFAALAGITIAWFALVDGFDKREDWMTYVPLAFVGVAFGIFAWLYLVAKADQSVPDVKADKSVPDAEADVQLEPCTICGHSRQV